MDSTTTQLKLLIDIIDKKILLLAEIFNITENQEQLVLQNYTEEPLFAQMIEEKQRRIDSLTDVDNTFMEIYENVRSVIIEAQPMYRDLIRQLQAKVFTVSDLEVKVKIQEQKNQAFGFSSGSVSSAKGVNLKKSRAFAIDSYSKSKNTRKTDKNKR